MLICFIDKLLKVINMKVRIYYMFLSNQFWAERKVYEACGMFTQNHMILLLLSISILSILLFISRDINNNQIKKVTKGLAVFITILEAIKIYFNFYWGYTWINAWFPMAYCSIFIYSLWLSGYGKGKWREMGDVFLAGASIVAGSTYLLFPSTALTIYPSGHYLSMYSMLFHTLMVYVGFIYLCDLEIKLDIKSYKTYVKLYLPFAILAIILNTLFGSNLMMIREPGNIPVNFLHTLYESNPWGYTSLVFIVYLLIPYWFTAYLNKVIKKSRAKKKVDQMVGITN